MRNMGPQPPVLEQFSFGEEFGSENVVEQEQGGTVKQVLDCAGRIEEDSTTV